MSTTTVEPTDKAFNVGGTGMMVQQQDARGRHQFYGKGHAVPEGVNTREALELSGLDFEVALRPLYVQHEDGHELVEDFVSTVRVDTDQVLGVVSPRYQIIQNRDAFDDMAPVVDDEQQGRWVAAGTLRGGRRVWGMIELAEPVVAAGDEILPYLLYQNDHTGGAAITAATVMNRLSCTNQLTWRINAAPGRVNVRHTGDLGRKMDEAMKVLGVARDYATEFAAVCDALGLQKVTDRQVNRWLKDLYPTDDSMGDRAIANREQTREVVRALMGESPNLEGHRGTAWAFVNAVAEHADWGTDRDGEQRMNRLVTDQDYAIKNRALGLVLDSRN